MSTAVVYTCKGESVIQLLLAKSQTIYVHILADVRQ